MTTQPTPEAALATALHNRGCGLVGCRGMDKELPSHRIGYANEAVLLLAALPGYQLVPVAEIERLRRIEAALNSEDGLRHAEAWHRDSKHDFGLGKCAYCGEKWPCRTERISAPLRAALERNPR